MTNKKLMKYFGVISCNFYTNFTNYGTVLQSWALCNVINKLGIENGWKSKLVDYCPDTLLDKDPLNPFKHSWDKDEESKRMIELTMPDIKVNYDKIMSFYHSQFEITNKYVSENFNEISQEKLEGYICGSDTVFCIDEFGFDNVFYANMSCMKNGKTISYAASFGDSHFDENTYQILNQRLSNFKAIGIREENMMDYVRKHVPAQIPVQRTIDPTLLLDADDYKSITLTEKLIEEPYILIYSRRYNPMMEQYADNLAKKYGYKVVEISLRACNKSKHIMMYSAGVEEFLSLVKNAEFVVTNSFHGLIFSTIFKTPFYVFSREQGDTKINELLDLFGLKNRLVNKPDLLEEVIDFEEVHRRINDKKITSLEYLNEELKKFN